MIQGPAQSTPHPDQPGAPVDSLRAAYRGLRAIGLTESEAGNLSAHLVGLAHGRRGWQFREIERLIFIRTLVESGRIKP